MSVVRFVGCSYVRNLFRRVQMTGRVRFSARDEPIDLELLDSVNVRLIVDGLGMELLQRTLVMVTYGRIADVLGDVDVKSAAVSGVRLERLLKLFQIAQFTNEYLLKTQEKLQASWEESQQKCSRLEKELHNVKSEYKRERKVWKAETEKLRSPTTETSSMVQCEFCAKVFLSASFLQRHLSRAHEYQMEQENKNAVQQQEKQLQQAEKGEDLGELTTSICRLFDVVTDLRIDVDAVRRQVATTGRQNLPSTGEQRDLPSTSKENFEGDRTNKETAKRTGDNVLCDGAAEEAAAFTGFSAKKADRNVNRRNDDERELMCSFSPPGGSL